MSKPTPPGSPRRVRVSHPHTVFNANMRDEEELDNVLELPALRSVAYGLSSSSKSPTGRGSPSFEPGMFVFLFSP